jgi:hypothetical protein
LDLRYPESAFFIPKRREQRERQPGGLSAEALAKAGACTQLIPQGLEKNLPDIGKPL